MGELPDRAAISCTRKFDGPGLGNRDVQSIGEIPPGQSPHGARPGFPFSFMPCRRSVSRWRQSHIPMAGKIKTPPRRHVLCEWRFLLSALSTTQARCVSRVSQDRAGLLVGRSQTGKQI